MELWDAIAARQSVRQWDNQRLVTEAQVRRILEAAVRAPSAGNLQPWRFLVIRDTAIKQGLSAASFGQSFVAGAPVVIAVCADPERSATRYGDRGRQLYCIQDTAAAITHIQLAAVALGLGTCWVGAFDEGMAADALGLPASLRPVALIPLGYPARVGTTRPRRPLDEVVVGL